MADLFGIGTLIGSVISSGINYASQQEANQTNRRIAQQNLEFQKQQLDYQKALQQEIFAREDTAHQREINDLRQAGINPLATANGGQGAGAGAIVNTQAMHNDFNQSPAQIDPTAILQAVAQIETHRNNKATEEIQQTTNENTRTKIESDESIKLLELEEQKYEHEQELLFKEKELAERTKDNEAKRKIDEKLAKLQEEWNQTMARHLKNQDQFAEITVKNATKRLNEIEIPQELRDRITHELNTEEARETIRAIELNNELTQEEKKYRLSREIQSWIHTTTDVADTVAGFIFPWKNTVINQQNANTNQQNAQTNQVNAQTNRMRALNGH